MSERIARRCLVSGRVQGVYFRASAREQAHRLNVTGHARNLPDGRVEVVIAGSPGPVSELINWLGMGPPSARVDQVEVVEIELDVVPAGFHIR